MVFRKMNMVKERGTNLFIYINTGGKFVWAIALSDQIACLHLSLSPPQIVPRCQAVHKMASGEEHRKIKQKRNGKREKILNSQRIRYAWSIQQELPSAMNFTSKVQIIAWKVLSNET